MTFGPRSIRRLLEEGGPAWDRFVRDHRPVVLAACASAARRFGRLAGDVEDAASEVFVALLENDGRLLRSFKGGSAFTTWLTVVSWRIASRGFARQAREKRLEAHHAPPAAPAPSDPEILAHLSKLPDRDRRALVLFHIEGASYAEIARALGIPSNQVGMILLRAREALAQFLGGSK